MFGVPPASVQVACPDVGGGFGVKNPLYPEYIGLLWAARHLGRPVRWLSGHGEDFVSTAHGRDNVPRPAGPGGDGRFLALEVDMVANLGAGMSTGGPGSSTNAPGNAMGCGYDIPAVSMAMRGAFTNTVPIDAYRGAGKPEANYLLERADRQARRSSASTGWSCAAATWCTSFRTAPPWRTTIDGGRFAANIDPALQAADATGFLRGVTPPPVPACCAAWA